MTINLRDYPLPLTKNILNVELGNWFVFGRGTVDGRELVDISDSQRDVFQHVPVELAEKMIAAHDKFVQELIEVSKDFGKETIDG